MWLALALALIGARRVSGRSTDARSCGGVRWRSRLPRAFAVPNVLEPPRGSHRVATMVEGSRITIEGRLYRESEREAYGDRLYVTVERAAEHGGAMSRVERQRPNRGPGGGSFKLGDEIRLSARIHFPAQLRKSRRIRLRGTDGARWHRRDDDCAEEIPRVGDLSNHRASFELSCQARLNR